MVRWLMAANPADRPSAREVLRSEVLPPTVGDDEITDLLRSLPDKYPLPCTTFHYLSLLPMTVCYCLLLSTAVYYYLLLFMTIYYRLLLSTTISY